MVGGLTKGYIEKTGLKLLKNFLGCYPADLQPKHKKKEFSIIFNLSKHNELGTHFVAISNQKNVLVYFDSLGKPCTNNLLKSFIKTNIKSKKYSSNRNKVQSDGSTLCGVFCLGFLLSQENKIQMNDFVKIFCKTNLQLNDEIILEFIKECKRVKY